ncbi:MAG: RDD family protein [Methylophilaceae bacterium]
MMQNASLIKRLAACLYELLTLLAIWLLSTFVFMLLFGELDTAFKRHLLQAFLWVFTGAYFTVCWVKTGQTLAMQAWKIKLVNVENDYLSFRQAMLRYVLATASLGFFGAGFLWSLVDNEQLFLHDRLLRTRLAQCVKD